jgi:hypothetical protein
MAVGVASRRDNASAGVKAERRSLESIAKPLTAAGALSELV